VRVPSPSLHRAPFTLYWQTGPPLQPLCVCAIAGLWGHAISSFLATESGDGTNLAAFAACAMARPPAELGVGYNRPTNLGGLRSIKLTPLSHLASRRTGRPRVPLSRGRRERDHRCQSWTCAQLFWRSPVRNASRIRPLTRYFPCPPGPLLDQPYLSSCDKMDSSAAHTSSWAPARCYPHRLLKTARPAPQLSRRSRPWRWRGIQARYLHSRSLPALVWRVLHPSRS
jgi:hypothetical protein